ncbi:hypothetical protein L6452_32926 [Arctium lappa]|uniref:Uncharacterized protein n=1 Tax=Arctium lappa TaxID=4217 RepID=A0ACB8Z5W1_ARCLA|nr:hypothetical protein L6452_32926 [Arctium lappa]
MERIAGKISCSEMEGKTWFSCSEMEGKARWRGQVGALSSLLGLSSTLLEGSGCSLGSAVVCDAVCVGRVCRRSVVAFVEV